MLAVIDQREVSTCASRKSPSLKSQVKSQVL